MEFGVLGSLRVAMDGRPVPIGSARQRTVLAALLFSANQPISISRLIDSVWGERPAGTAQALVHTYVWRLRTLMADDGGRRVVTEPGGYRLRTDPGELDAAEFERLAGLGRRALAGGDAARAEEQLRAALALWRGDPYADAAVHDTAHAAEIHRLAEARVTAREDHVEAGLQLGRHEHLISELRQLTLEHPLRERAAGQFMLACFRAGRQADALAAYARIRVALAEELGLDPGRELRDLHGRILRADPGLLVGGRIRAVRHPSRPVPRQLPAAAPHFAGREAELSALTGLLDRRAATADAAVISVIDGAAGIGKTTLALHWGQLNLARFPDGQLYVNLRGFSSDVEPVTPAEAVRGFLDALAVPADRVPRSLDAQTALYRSLLADKRLLVVLDNARDTDQVRPLLPAGPGCVSLVTSRNRLAGFIAAEGARPVTLDLLTAAEAGQLLARRLGPERVAAEPEAVSALIELCARLPLALSIAAARATADAALSLADLVAELRAARNRLDALDLGDRTTDLRAVFSWSYRRLSPPAKGLFRLLGVHAGPDIAPPAVASLAGLSPAKTSAPLDELVRSQLMTEPEPGRYTFHDLLRAYAAELANGHDDKDERRAAVHRVLDHYLHSAYAAVQEVNLFRIRRSPVPMPDVQPATVPENFADEKVACAWLEAERPALMAAVAQAAADGFDRHATLLPWILANFLDHRAYWHDYFTAQRTALAVAERLDDLPEQARAHRLLGSAYARMDAAQEAHAHLQQALELHIRLGDRPGQAHTEHAIGWVFHQQGRYTESLDHALRALELYQAEGHRVGEADCLNSVGWLYSHLGEHREALKYCERAMNLHLEMDDQFGQAHTADSFGHIHEQTGDHAQALAWYEQALNLHQAVGSRYNQSNTLDRIGDTRNAMGATRAARDAWRQALAILDELDHADADRLRAKLQTR